MFNADDHLTLRSPSVQTRIFLSVDYASDSITDEISHGGLIHFVENETARVAEESGSSMSVESFDRRMSLHSYIHRNIAINIYSATSTRSTESQSYYDVDKRNSRL
jgi:hypothetical protein